MFEICFPLTLRGSGIFFRFVWEHKIGILARHGIRGTRTGHLNAVDTPLFSIHAMKSRFSLLFI